jgi:hypothetical protein
MIEYEYKTLKDVLYQIAIQAKKDINYMGKKIPFYVRTAQELFFYLKSVTIYRDDPPDVELLQRPKSLFEKNFYGIPGMGDCDCFTILGIASLLALNYELTEIDVILVGRSNKDAVHIYLQVCGENFDLTNETFGIARKYPYLQTIPLSKIWPK